MRDETRIVKEEYNAMNAWGILTSVDIHDCDPGLIRSASAIKEFVVQLCDLIEMKRFGEPVIVHFGDDEKVAGYSMTQLIETSLISAHFANLTNNVYLDIFSCKYYNPEKAAEFSKNYFKGKDSNINVV
ncbi:MAG TPA: S-adenosylmethionine decarboxylase, partial [Candidatus Deferrimicrobium sp.]|nr:S-adenosylmethionine decarboxylase [Candidatus Deferrimicrobium sp.]